MDFATPAQLDEAEDMTIHIINAVATWGDKDVGNIATGGDARRNIDGIRYAMKMARLDILRAIAQNPNHAYWSDLATIEPVLYGAKLPSYDAIGVPQIQPFAGATTWFNGLEKSADQIQSIVEDAGQGGLYTRMCGVAVAHNIADENGIKSPVSCWYNIQNGLIHFTGEACRIPMVQIVEDDADDRFPFSLLPTCIKIAVGNLIKEGDNFANYAQIYVNAGLADLNEIRAGATTVMPVPDVQK